MDVETFYIAPLILLRCKWYNKYVCLNNTFISGLSGNKDFGPVSIKLEFGSIPEGKRVYAQLKIYAGIGLKWEEVDMRFYTAEDVIELNKWREHNPTSNNKRVKQQYDEMFESKLSNTQILPLQDGYANFYVAKVLKQTEQTNIKTRTKFHDLPFRFGVDLFLADILEDGTESQLVPWCQNIDTRKLHLVSSKSFLQFRAGPGATLCDQEAQYLSPFNPKEGREIESFSEFDTSLETSSNAAVGFGGMRLEEAYAITFSTGKEGDGKGVDGKARKQVDRKGGKDGKGGKGVKNAKGTSKRNAKARVPKDEQPPKKAKIAPDAGAQVMFDTSSVNSEPTSSPIHQGTINGDLWSNFESFERLPLFPQLSVAQPGFIYVDGNDSSVRSSLREIEELGAPDELNDVLDFF